MKCLDDHHNYHLNNFEDGKPSQTLIFIKKEPSANPTHLGELRTIHDGTTNEEVLRVLIHRLQGLNNKFPCRENSIIIIKLEESLMWLEKRTNDRKIRGVEGKQLP